MQRQMQRQCLICGQTCSRVPCTKRTCPRLRYCRLADVLLHRFILIGTQCVYCMMHAEIGLDRAGVVRVCKQSMSLARIRVIRSICVPDVKVLMLHSVADVNSCIMSIRLENKQLSESQHAQIAARTARVQNRSHPCFNAKPHSSQAHRSLNLEGAGHLHNGRHPKSARRCQARGHHLDHSAGPERRRGEGHSR